MDRDRLNQQLQALVDTTSFADLLESLTQVCERTAVRVQKENAFEHQDYARRLQLLGTALADTTQAARKLTV